MEIITVKIRRKGVITLPADVRRRHRLSEGDALTLVDLGEGVLMLLSHASEVARFSNEITGQLEAGHISLEDLLPALDEERETYYREHHQEASTLPQG